MKQAALLLALAAATSATPACDSDVPPAPHAAPVPGVAAPPAAAATPPSEPPARVAAAPTASGPDALPVPVSDAPAPPPPPPPMPATPAAADSVFPSHVTLTAGSAWTAPAGRSPLGGPGESTPQPALRLGEVATADPAPDAPAVPWDQAHRHVGEQITVEGRVVNTHRSKSRVVFLNFDKDWKGKFYVPVFRDAYVAMPTAAEVFFLNKTVRVTGEVELFKGTPNIEVNALSQIVVVAEP